MRKSVLVVAQQIQLRARIARVLHSAGYCAELAENPKRALELAARKDIQAAIVVDSPDLAGLGQELLDKIPTTILVGIEPTRSSDRAIRFRGQVCLLKMLWMSRSCSIGSASQRRCRGTSAMKLSQRR